MILAASAWVMPGSTFRSAALALLMSTIAAFGVTVACEPAVGFAAAAGAAGFWFALPVAAGSAARTGPAIVRARIVSGSWKNFDIDFSKTGTRNIVAPGTRSRWTFFRPSQKDHQYDLLAVIDPRVE